MKKKIRFIINPFSGIGKKKTIPTLLDKHLDTNIFEWDVVYTERPKHAVEIANDSVAKGYHAVVAVGGDGSINEVARCLIHCDTALGIIPVGSGNGIARSLNISMKIREAIGTINNFRITKIDTGQLNKHAFVGVAGIGFDAEISQEFAKRKIRGKMSYGYLIIKKLSLYRPISIRITGSVIFQSKKALVLTFANTSQYGNNAYIAPTAIPTDGRLKLSIIEEFGKLQIPDMALKLLRKKILNSSKVTYLEFDEIEVTHDSKFAHIDGEPIEIAKKILVKVIPRSLNVICP